MAAKSRRYAMAPAHIPVFLSQKPSTKNGIIRHPASLSLAWVLYTGPGVRVHVLHDESLLSLVCRCAFPPSPLPTPHSRSSCANIRQCPLVSSYFVIFQLSKIQQCWDSAKMNPLLVYYMGTPRVSTILTLLSPLSLSSDPPRLSICG